MVNHLLHLDLGIREVGGGAARYYLADLISARFVESRWLHDDVGDVLLPFDERYHVSFVLTQHHQLIFGQKLVYKVLRIDVRSQNIHDVKSFNDFFLSDLIVGRLDSKRVINLIPLELRGTLVKHTTFKLEVVLLNLSPLTSLGLRKLIVGFAEADVFSFTWEELGVRSKRSVH